MTTLICGRSLVKATPLQEEGLEVDFWTPFWMRNAPKSTSMKWDPPNWGGRSFL